MRFLSDLSDIFRKLRYQKFSKNALKNYKLECDLKYILVLIRFVGYLSDVALHESADNATFAVLLVGTCMVFVKSYNTFGFVG